MRNPIRRNKNIGKTQGGRIRNGRAVQKESRESPQNVWRQISENNEKWQVFTENPSRDFYHPCTGEDYINVLKQLPAELTKYVSAIVLRRTSAEDEALGIDAWRRYQCVLMNAFPKSNETLWTQLPSKGTVHHLAP